MENEYIYQYDTKTENWVSDKNCQFIDVKKLNKKFIYHFFVENGKVFIISKQENFNENYIVLTASDVDNYDSTYFYRAYDIGNEKILKNLRNSILLREQLIIKIQNFRYLYKFETDLPIINEVVYISAKIGEFSFKISFKKENIILEINNQLDYSKVIIINFEYDNAYFNISKAIDSYLFLYSKCLNKKI